MSEQELLDNLRLLVLAGHETTGSVMAWMVAYVMTDQAVGDAFFAEIRSVSSFPATPRHLADFPFTEALFREVLRVHPPAPLVSRVVSGPLDLEGVRIPEGTVVLIPIARLGKDPELFSNPERFDPARWLKRDRKPTPIETVPFGGGPHFCLGYHMAWLESVQFMVTLGRALDDRSVRLRFPRGLPRESFVPLLRPKKGDTRCRVVRQ